MPKGVGECLQLGPSRFHTTPDAVTRPVFPVFLQHPHPSHLLSLLLTSYISHTGCSRIVAQRPGHFRPLFHICLFPSFPLLLCCWAYLGPDDISRLPVVPRRQREHQPRESAQPLPMANIIVLSHSTTSHSTTPTLIRPQFPTQPYLG